MNVFITGVSKGIGFALATEALNHGHTVFGVARDPQDLKTKLPNLNIIPLDLKSPEASEKLLKALVACESLDLVINNAGIYEKGNSKEEFRNSFEVNSYIPFMVSETLLPKLKKSKTPKLVHITSLMGSIADNGSGSSYAYRASKTALNMINKCLTVENSWLTTLVIHPGWVQTSMGGASAPVKIQESGQGIWRVIEQLKNEESGCFKDYQGKSLPW